MMPTEMWLIFIISVCIVASIVALELKDILSSIIAVGVVGLGIAISFLILQAPDLAVVQFVFEIFAVIILVRAFMKKDYHKEEPSTINKVLIGVTLITLGAIFYLSLSVFKLLPPFGQPLFETAQYYVQNGATDTGAANLVSGIILDYRAYDTLGEVTVLFTAILGVLTILRVKKSKKNQEVTDEK